MRRRDYQRNQDDIYTDPSLVSSRYQLGRNAFFEVELALAELDNKSINSSGGGSSSAGVSGGSLGGLGGGGGGIGGGGGFCPRVDQFIWIKGDQGISKMPVLGILDNIGSIRIYNPVSTKGNLLIKAELIQNSLIVRVKTKRGAELICSPTHKGIRNTADIDGFPINTLPIGGEILSFQDNGHLNIYTDELLNIEKLDNADVIRFTLDSEFLYVAGTSNTGIVSHNNKEAKDGGEFLLL